LIELTRTEGLVFPAWAKFGLTLLTAGIVAIAAVSSASAAVNHVYDPSLSLGGGTSTTPVDPVPDPGSAHPAKPFNDPCGVTTDAYGDIYVANGASSTHHEEAGETRFDGRIDIFDSNGEFVTEVVDLHWPCSVAVDANGKLYVHEFWTGDVVRYDPTVYDPEQGEIAYGSSSTPVASGVSGMGMDPSNDHLFLARHPTLTLEVEELKSDGGFDQFFTEPAIWDATDVAASGLSKEIFVTGAPGLLQHEPNEGRVFAIDRESHEITSTFDGSSTPDGRFSFTFGTAGIAVDQETGHVYVADIFGNHVVDEFAPPEEVSPGEEAPEKYLGQFGLPANGLKNSEPYSDIAVDSGEHSPNRGYVYVTSGFQESNSHLYAFEPLILESPEVRNEHASEVGSEEAVLAAELNPHGAFTSYHFEYGLADCSTSICQSVPVPSGQAGAGGAFKAVSARAARLSGGTRYHFRLVATSHCNPAAPEEECRVEGADTTFTTFLANSSQDCPNAAVKVGPSAHLPDCRAYELVSPANTNGRVPTATLFGEGVTSPPVLLGSADGESVLFGTEGGALPGLGGGGFHDAYVSTRAGDGWHTEFRGLTGSQAQKPIAGGTSPDHAYSFWDVEGTKGTLANESGGPANATMNYLRGPGGTIEPVGVGSLGSDARAKGRWVSAGAEHVVFTASETRLEPGAPPVGTEAIYDRSPGGATRVISLLPNDVTPQAGENAEYLGTAAQGSVVAFRIGEAIYERTANDTAKIADEPATFAGLSADGGRAFYVKGGDIFAFELASRTTSLAGSGGESTIVNISADGSHVYFASGLVLTSEASATGEKPVPDHENIYAWDADSKALRFVATVEEIDLVGEPPPVGGTEALIGGLGLWLPDVVAPDQDQFRGPANDPSRTSPSGEIFVFESRAKLTDYKNEGHSEIYRYDDVSGSLVCVSCNPSEVSAVSDAHLESRYAPRLHSVPPVNAISLVANVSRNGDRVFFESGDALSFEDTDETSDVYEWKADGVDGCESPKGCVDLISLGRSAAPNYLYGVGANGRDVFFWSSDELVNQDAEGGHSIYDARIWGGFPSPPPVVPCQAEGCQGAVASPPILSAPANLSGGHRRLHHGRKKKHSKHRSGRLRGHHHRGNTKKGGSK
jgi:DNA-binding beta-propeller fold protein YncE